MIIKKSDWTIVQEAENNGLMVAMTSIVERKRTDLNNELSRYFRMQYPHYKSSFDEYEAEDVLYSINEYLKDNHIGISSLEFPLTSGTEVYLIPINENIHLKVIVADEYEGDGNYSKYVMANFFMINEKTNKEEVDVLISFLKKHLK